MALRPLGKDGLSCKIGKTTMLSTVTAAALIVLLVMFYVTTVNNMVAIDSRVASIKSGPYPVSVAAGRIETLLVQLKTLAERSTYERASDAVDRMEESYAAVDVDMREKVEFIASAHALDSEDARTLQQQYETLAGYQAAYLEMYRDEAVPDQQVESYANETIVPLIDGMLAIDRAILDDSTEAVEDLYGTVTTIGFQTVLLASALMAAVLVSLGVFLGLLLHKQQQQRRLQQDLEATLAYAQGANAAKSQFLSSMSHDIRTPMNAIVGLTAIAGSHLGETARVAECLERIAVSSRHLLCLINDVLDIGKIESGKIALSEARFAFSDVVSELMAIVQPQAKAKNLTLEVVAGPLDHEVVLGDSMRLNQALLNLLGNAVKYTPQGGSVKLAIAEMPGTKPGFGLYRFVVSDTGMGMSQDFLKKIFDPFERDDSNPAAREIEGTGLGMAITKNVVDMMHGTIDVASVRGEGSVFTMIVPLKFAEEDDGGSVSDGLQDSRDRTVESGSHGESGNSRRLKGRVLVVEDNDLNREIAKELICQIGAEVDEARDGEEALRKVLDADEGSYDLVFMDVQMPRMGGVEATQALCAAAERSGRRLPPIIAMTASVFDEDRSRALAAGMDGFMTKPIDLKELERMLRAYLA